MKIKNILTLIVAAGLTSFAANAKAAVIYSDTPINTENWMGRFTTVLGFENLLLIGAYPGMAYPGMEMPGDANLYYGSGSTVAQFVSAQLNDSIGSTTSGLSSFLELNNGNQYVGFSFNNNGTTNYGWLALSVSGVGQTPDFGQFMSNTSVNITSAAYENTGLSIYVGQTTSAVPEPSTYGLIGIGALGLAFAARRRKIKSA
jgi:hypothetical protein